MRLLTLYKLAIHFGRHRRICHNCENKILARVFSSRRFATRTLFSFLVFATSGVAARLLGVPIRGRTQRCNFDFLYEKFVPAKDRVPPTSTCLQENPCDFVATLGVQGQPTSSCPPILSAPPIPAIAAGPPISSHANPCDYRHMLDSRSSSDEN